MWGFKHEIENKKRVDLNIEMHKKGQTLDV